MLHLYRTFTVILLLAFSVTAQAQLNYYYGNLHAHSSYSDGNKDEGTTGISTPGQNFAYAKGSYHFDFLGISEHNHYQAGLHTPVDFHKGMYDADTSNVNGTFVAMYGMEWGVIENGGHVLIYGYPNLIGWDTIFATHQPDFDVYCPKFDYDSLWKILATNPNVFASLAHPDTYDYDSLNQRNRNALYDGVIAGIAVRSGSAFSTTTTYSDPPATLYESFYRKALAKGYHVAPSIDHDNHYLTFGRTSETRTVILASTLHRDTLLSALRQMHFYASDDWNARLSFTVNGNMMGSDIATGSNSSIAVTVTDVDLNDTVTKIDLYYGVPGSGTNATILNTAHASTLNYTHNVTLGQSYYYYAKVTQADGDILWSAPIWINRSVSLGVAIHSFYGTPTNYGNSLSWTAGTASGSASYTIERSADNKTYTDIGHVTANLSEGATYHFLDAQPLAGINYYRLQQLENNGTETFSNTITVYHRLEDFHLLSLHPNPVTTTLTLQYATPEDRQVMVQIYNEQGRVQYSKTYRFAANDKTLLLPVSSLAPGKYYITLSSVDEGRIAESSFIKL